jgi:hypothetical protein
LIEDYFLQLETLIRTTGIVQSSRVTYDKRSTYVGYVRGEIYFLDASCLHLREYVNTERGAERYVYAYHYQRPDGSLIFRYDNTRHYRALPTFPHHKHLADDMDVVPAPAPDLPAVVDEIRQIVVMAFRDTATNQPNSSQ